MELLILGIDGGDERIIRGMDMPFLQSLFDRSVKHDLEEDLFTRGWAETLTGLTAAECRSMYMSPVLDGTPSFKFKYNTSDVTGKDYVTPLWDLVNNNGRTLGIMNVPTTAPAVEMNGFMVSGGGGGVNKVDGIPPQLIYPADLAEHLLRHNYVFDVRFGSSDILDFSTFLEHINTIICTRTKTYLDLVSNYKPDIGYLCFRVPTEIQYMAMPEIESILAGQSMPEIAGRDVESDPKLNPKQTLILNHYRLLDEQIREVFETIAPQRYIITSDHSASRYLFNINPDALLKEHGYLVTGQEGISVKKLMRSLILDKLPSTVRRRFITTFAKHTPASIRKAVTRFDVGRTKAFSYWYMKGVFINDSKRFGGPVREGAELNDLVDEICDIFNKDTRSRQVELKAKPFRRHFMDKRFADNLPDILFDHIDEVFFLGQGDYIARNEDYGPIPEDLTQVKAMHAGQKGRHPLFFADPSTASLVEDKPYTDLRLVYETVKRLVSEPKSHE